jgi:hypothetical protein
MLEEGMCDVRADRLYRIEGAASAAGAGDGGEKALLAISVNRRSLDI